jgi:phage-related tail fiber protein
LSEQFYTILTATGKAKIANGIPFGTKVNFTTLKVGDGKGSYYNPTESQTDLINTKWQGTISSVSTDEVNPNWIVIEIIIPGKDGGFTIREAGIFDDEGDMIAIGKYPETYKPIIADGSTKELLIRIILEVTNAESIVMKIDPTIILATKKDIQVLESKIQEINGQLKDLSNKVTSHLADNKGHVPYGVATGTANTYAVTLSPAPTAYVDGMALCVKINATNTGPSTINVNGLGAKAIKDSLGNVITSSGLKANTPYTMRFESTSQSFIIQGYASSKIIIRTTDPGSEAAIDDVWLDLTSNVFKVKLSNGSWKIIGAAYN